MTSRCTLYFDDNDNNDDGHDGGGTGDNHDHSGSSIANDNATMPRLHTERRPHWIALVHSLLRPLPEMLRASKHSIPDETLSLARVRPSSTRYSRSLSRDISLSLSHWSHINKPN